MGPHIGESFGIDLDAPGQGCAAGGHQPPPADGVGGNGRGLPWLPPSVAHVAPHLSRELLKQKVCDRRKRDKKRARRSASGRAQRRLCSEGGSSLSVSLRYEI